jgi:hypothetical protein
MLVSLLVATMALSDSNDEDDFASSTCRHFALLFASPWGCTLPPELPLSSKYTSYPLLGDLPTSVAGLRHLHPRAILNAFQDVSCGGQPV